MGKVITSIFDMLAGLLTNKQAAALKTLRELARDEAEGKSATAADAERLHKMLLDAGMDVSDFHQLVATYRAYHKCVHDCRDVDKLQADATAAARKRDEQYAETQRIMQARAQEWYELNAASANADYAFQMAEKALERLQVFEQENAALLGKTPPCLDDYTLYCNGSVLSPNDPNAPRLFVSEETFQREGERRWKLLQAEHAAAQAEFAKAWEQRQALERNSEVPLKSAHPVKREPTWADALKKLKTA